MTPEEIAVELRDITRRLWAIADALRPVKTDGIPAPNDDPIPSGLEAKASHEQPLAPHICYEACDDLD